MFITLYGLINAGFMVHKEIMSYTFYSYDPLISLSEVFIFDNGKPVLIPNHLFYKWINVSKNEIEIEAQNKKTGVFTYFRYNKTSKKYRRIYSKTSFFVKISTNNRNILLQSISINGGF